MSSDPNTIDNFQLINCVASGSHSQIWEVSEHGGSQRFAMKLLLPDAHADREIVATLKHEAKVQKSLTHPNFIQLRQLVTNKQHAYIVMDFFRSTNLKVQISSDLDGLQSRIRKLIEGICIALAYLHDKGWVHRDIKPENILFNKSAELRLIDFSLSVRHASGVSKLFGGKPKGIQGTRTYIAPETLLKKSPTPQTDIYSLGVTLFELLTGDRPFTASTPDQLLNKHLKERPPAPSEFNSNVTPEMDALILRMLSKKPDKRHANMNELLAEFRAVKVFKQDVKEMLASKERRRKEIEETGGDLSKAWTLDSRSDAMRTEKGGGPTERTPPRPSKPASMPQQPRPASSPAASPSPPQQPYPGQGVPGAVPQYAYPGYYHQPGMMPPPSPQPPPPAAPAPQYTPPPGYPTAGGHAGYPHGAPPMPGPPPPGSGTPPTPPQPSVQQPPAQQPPPVGQPPAGPPSSGQPPVEQPPHPTSAPMPARPPSDEHQVAASGPPASTQPSPAAPSSEEEAQDQIAPEEIELRPQAPIPAERHASQSDDDDDDLPLMEELPEIV